MKKFSLIAMLMALFTFAIACTPEVPEGIDGPTPPNNPDEGEGTEPPIEMTISVTPAQLVFTAEGGTQNVNTFNRSVGQLLIMGIQSTILLVLTICFTNN